MSAELSELRETVRQAQDERRLLESRVAQERHEARQARLALERRLEAVQQREEEVARQLQEVAASSEVRGLKSDLELARERLADLESDRAAAERIIAAYGAGVCLIQGAYAFYDAQRRPLRYLHKSSEDGQRARPRALSVHGAGEVHTVEYFGSGFLVDRRGLLLTNRHLAEPWWQDEAAAELMAAGLRPRFVLFRAFFPHEIEPFALDVERLSDDTDLALLRITPRGRKIPVLPLDVSGGGAVAGQPVAVLGYPTGLEALLAKAEAAVVEEILHLHGGSSQRITEALSAQRLIRPSATQGHIGDVTSTDIVFDAASSLGGSGGPVFNKAGRVIAVEYAVLTRFGGNAFGIPIRNAIELLRPDRTRRFKPRG